MVVQRGSGNFQCNLEFDKISSRSESTMKTNTSSVGTWMTNLPAVSNCTNSEAPTQVKWKNTFHMRQMTLSNISSNNGQVRQTLSAQAAGARLRSRCMTSSAKSLDLLRLNIQAAINKEIDAIIKKYLEKFFQPAVENIRNNLGENSVTEENIRTVCRQILEDAKSQYYITPVSGGSSPYSDSEASSFNDYRCGHIAGSPMSFLQKRKESDTDSEASQSIVRPRKKIIRTLTNLTTDKSSNIKVMRMNFIRRESPKWDPARFIKSTLFIMGARANKVLGFGQTRGRLYTKHPELFKYSGDTEDKEWLSRHNLMPPTGGKAYLLVLEDIKELADSDEYRYNPNILLNELKGFEAPDFMLAKIRAFVSEPPAEIRNDLVNTVTCVTDNTEIMNRYSLGVDSVMTPPATVLDSAPGTPCDSLELIECQQSDVFQNDFSNLVYSNIDPSQSLIFTNDNTHLLTQTVVPDKIQVRTE